MWCYKPAQREYLLPCLFWFSVIHILITLSDWVESKWTPLTLSTIHLIHFFFLLDTTTRCSTAFRTHNDFRHKESGALKTCECRDASASRALCLYIYLFICWLRLLGPAEHKIAYYYSHGRFIISIETRVYNSVITHYQAIRSNTGKFKTLA